MVGWNGYNVTRGHQPGLSRRICRLPGCDAIYTPVQPRQRYCVPAHRHDANRLKTAIPVAQDYLQRVLDELADDAAVTP